jgi:hypothetical protein
MGCWGLLGLLLVMTGMIPENSLLSTSKIFHVHKFGPFQIQNDLDYSAVCIWAAKDILTSGYLVAC